MRLTIITMSVTIPAIIPNSKVSTGSGCPWEDAAFEKSTLVSRNTPNFINRAPRPNCKGIISKNNSDLNGFFFFMVLTFQQEPQPVKLCRTLTVNDKNILSFTVCVFPARFKCCSNNSLFSVRPHLPALRDNLRRSVRCLHNHPQCRAF